MRACEGQCGHEVWGGRKRCIQCQRQRDLERWRQWSARRAEARSAAARPRTIKDEDPEDEMTDEQIEAAVQAAFDKAKADIRARRNAA